jgi:DNA-binding transcriptional ArsR family regulator
METTASIAALAALAQEHRLEVFRVLVRAGEAGLPAGQIATALGIPNNTLSFHLDRLRNAGLVTQQRQGRSIIYAANYATMNALVGYLTENCCAGRLDPAGVTTCDAIDRRRARVSKRESV